MNSMSTHTPTIRRRTHQLLRMKQVILLLHGKVTGEMDRMRVFQLKFTITMEQKMVMNLSSMKILMENKDFQQLLWIVQETLL
jgi:hypothetical protein